MGRFIRVLDAVSGGAFQRHFLEAAVAGDDDPRADEYRKLSGTKRDLAPLKFKRAQQLSFYTWQRNPLAARLIQILVDFCVGDEFAVKVKIMRRKDGKNEDTGRMEAQNIWDDFYADPVNRLESDFKLFLKDLFINGELLVPAFVNRKDTGNGTFGGDSMVRLGYIDPDNIKDIITSPENIREVQQIVVSPPDSTAKEITKDIIHVDTNPKNIDTFGKMIGNCFYWRINHVINQKRGHGELIQLVDWLDATDQFLFDALEGFRLRQAFFYQLELQGMKQKDIDDLQKKIKTPGTGTVRVTNEKAKWSTVTPDLKAADVDTAFKMLLHFVVGSKGYPAHWFGSGDDANLAVGKVMATPTMRMLKATQKMCRDIIKDMISFVTDQAVIGKTLKLSEDEFVDSEITMFDFDKDSASNVAASFVQIVQALTLAKGNSWVSDETAKKVIDGIVGRFGVEIAEDETAEGIHKKDEDKQNEDIFKGVPPLVPEEV